MKSLKWFCLTLTTLSLVACAFDKNSNTDNQRELEDNAALLEKFSRVTGLYSTVTTKSGVQQVEISFYPYFKKIGENTNGEDKYKPELRARYRRLDTVVADVIMSVRFYEETSQILMSNVDDKAGTILNVDARLIGDTITGNISQNSVPLGQLKVRLVTRQYSIPNPNDQAEFNARLRKHYDSITGTYEGVVKPAPRDGAAFAIRIKLRHIDRTIDDDQGPVPVLEASFYRLDNIDLGKEIVLRGDYQSDAKPLPRISMNYTNAKDEKANTISIAGTISQGLITGIYKGYLGIEGEAILKKRR